MSALGLDARTSAEVSVYAPRRRRVSSDDTTIRPILERLRRIDRDEGRASEPFPRLAGIDTGAPVSATKSQFAGIAIRLLLVAGALVVVAVGATLAMQETRSVPASDVTPLQGGGKAGFDGATLDVPPVTMPATETTGAAPSEPTAWVPRKEVAPIYFWPSPAAAAVPEPREEVQAPAETKPAAKVTHRRLATAHRVRHQDRHGRWHPRRRVAAPTSLAPASSVTEDPAAAQPSASADANPNTPKPSTDASLGDTLRRVFR